MIHDGRGLPASGFLGVGPKVLFRPRTQRPPSCVGGGGEEGGRDEHNHYRRGKDKAAEAAATLGGPSGGEEEEEKEEGGLASAPRGVGGGATRGTGIGNKRPFSAPWQGFRDALEGTGPALGQADVGAGCDDSDAGVRWRGGADLGAGQSFPIRD